jgi:hypothetical protein
MKEMALVGDDALQGIMIAYCEIYKEVAPLVMLKKIPFNRQVTSNSATKK